MRDLGGFSREATPVFANFGKAAPSLTVASQQLAPFATATNISAAQPRRRRRRGRAAAGRGRPDDPEPDQPREDRLASADQPRAPAQEPAEDQGLREADGLHLQQHRLGQRVRPVRPPAARELPGHQLHRLRDGAGRRVSGELEASRAAAPASREPRPWASWAGCWRSSGERSRRRRRQGERDQRAEQGTPESADGATRKDLEGSGASGSARDVLNYLLGQ